jgi:hypothetical protein
MICLLFLGFLHPQGIRCKYSCHLGEFDCVHCVAAVLSHR